MVSESWPYEGVAVNEERWRAMARLWRRSGVVDDVAGELAVSAVAGELQVSVAAGEGWLDGHYYSNGSAATLTLATADLNDDRVDLVVVRSTAESGATLAVLTGTPAATPTVPTPTQDHETAGVWELPLAEVTVGAAAGNVDGQVVDVRTFSLVPQDEGFLTEAEGNAAYAAAGHAHGSGATDAEQNVRLWQLEADVLGTAEGFTGWQGEGFLVGQDEVASLTGLSVRRDADLSVGALGILAGSLDDWTSRTSAADNSWLSVVWSAEAGLFVAVAGSGTGDRVMTSPDGITWTSRTSAADNSWRSVVWSAEAGLFVAVAYTGTGNRVMTSPDGITWTSRTSAADNSWYSVVWSAEAGLFVAVAGSGTGDRVMTSPDGITWTSRTSAADNNWYSVVWSAEVGLFVAVAYSGTGNRVMTSPDGITWTSRTSAADNNWYSVVWSAEVGLFVAVAYSGTGNRVMTASGGTDDSGTLTLKTVTLPATADTIYLLDDVTLDAGVTLTYEATLDGGTTWETVTAGDTVLLAHLGTAFTIRVSMSRAAGSSVEGRVFWAIAFAS